jgi:general secretion pathway protein G
MRDKGYTLIELLIVVAVLGIVSAIAVPNLINAMNRARQKRTMADMRGIAEAVEMYHTDVMTFPVHDGVEADLLEDDLRIYVKQFNGSDGWNKPFYYISDGEHYTLRSSGSDGLVDATSSFGPTSRFATDIVFADGVFVQWPEGAQRQQRPGGT